MAASITAVLHGRPFRPVVRRPCEAVEAEVALRAGQLWRAGGNNCWRAIICRGGVVWITQDWDVQDYVLEAGEILIVSQPGKVIVQALSDAKLEVTACMTAQSFKGRFQDAVFQ